MFLQTDHAHLLALDRLTGKLLWDVEMADYRLNYGATGAPLVVNDLVIAGISAGDEGVRGFLDAYNASTGERAWRFWTVPARGEPGSETWIGKALEHGCAATWLTGTYDPEARLLYWPTGNPCPDYNGDERKGDNLYSSSVVALDPATGRLKWHFQFTPHDLHDWDANQPPVLIDAEFRGRQRKLLALGSRNGFFYVLDRLTGEFLLGEPFVKNLTWASGIRRDGRPELLEGNEPSAEGTRACPSVSGAANWPSTSFNPTTGLFYLMASEACADLSQGTRSGSSSASRSMAARQSPPLSKEEANSLRALDLQTGKVVWEIRQRRRWHLGERCDDDRRRARLLRRQCQRCACCRRGQHWESAYGISTPARSGRRVPMTYAINGRQYIGVVAGSIVMVFGLHQ